MHHQSYSAYIATTLFSAIVNFEVNFEITSVDLKIEITIKIINTKGADCITLKVRNHWSDSTTVKSTISKDGRVLFNLVQVVNSLFTSILLLMN